MAAYRNLQSDVPELRRVVFDYVRKIGSGGLVSYAALQDLLAITDFYSLLVLSPATKYIKMHKLRAIESYVRHRNEMPGAQILDPDNTYLSDDIRLRSLLSDKSLHTADLIALANSQQSVGVKNRKVLVPKPHKTEDRIVRYCAPNIEIHIGNVYFDTLLSKEGISSYSGITDAFEEPTPSWRDLPLEEKGVFFLANQSFYGIVMPHAKTSTDNTKSRNNY